MDRYCIHSLTARSPILKSMPAISPSNKWFCTATVKEARKQYSNQRRETDKNLCGPDDGLPLGSLSDILWGESLGITCQAKGMLTGTACTSIVDNLFDIQKQKQHFTRSKLRRAVEIIVDKKFV